MTATVNINRGRDTSTAPSTVYELCPIKMLYVLLLYYFTMGLRDTQDLKCAGLQTYKRLDVAKLLMLLGM